MKLRQVLGHRGPRVLLRPDLRRPVVQGKGQHLLDFLRGVHLRHVRQTGRSRSSRGSTTSDARPHTDRKRARDPDGRPARAIRLRSRRRSHLATNKPGHPFSSSRNGCPVLNQNCRLRSAIAPTTEPRTASSKDCPQDRAAQAPFRRSTARRPKADRALRDFTHPAVNLFSFLRAAIRIRAPDFGCRQSCPAAAHRSIAACTPHERCDHPAKRPGGSPQLFCRAGSRPRRADALPPARRCQWTHPCNTLLPFAPRAGKRPALPPKLAVWKRQCRKSVMRARRRFG